MEEEDVYRTRNELEQNILQTMGYQKISDIREYISVILFEHIPTSMFHRDGG